MTEREKEILELIKMNPFMSQQEIGKRLGIERSSVAVHISNLLNKGYIKGRGYIIDEKKYILVIGACNVDVFGISKMPVIKNTSNPGEIKYDSGGVGRNIACNICNLGYSVKLLSSVGEDYNGKRILKKTSEIGVDCTYIKYSEKYPTSTYISILNDDGEREIALSDMSITKDIDNNYINKNKKLIQNAKIVVIDVNLEKSVIENILNITKDKVIVDCVSISKCIKIKEYLHKIYCIRLNEKEAEKLVDFKLDSDVEIENALIYLKQQGVKIPVIVFENKFVACLKKSKMKKYKIKTSKITNENGVGEAFSAGLSVGIYNNLNLEKMIKNCCNLASLTLENENTCVDLNKI